MVLFAHLLAGLCLPPGVGEAGPPGPVGGQHEAAEDEEGEDLLEPGPPGPQHEADQRDKQRQPQEHVNIPDNGWSHGHMVSLMRLLTTLCTHVPLLPEAVVTGK